MLDPTYPLYPVLAGLSIILLLLPVPWHWKNRNSGTLLFVGWSLTGTIIYLVGSIVWHGNMKNVAPVWCDIVGKLIPAISAAIPASFLCVNRRLYNIATVKQVRITKSDTRRSTIIDLCIGLGIPVLVMILHYISQGHRYDIIENIGCYPSTYVTPVAVVTLFTWPIIISSITFVYSVLAILSFAKQRRQFSDVLQSQNSGLTVNRYFRLMALASTEVFFTLPLALYIFIMNCKYVNPWINWADTKLNFNRVEYYPFAYFKLFPASLMMINIARYSFVANGVLFFCFFGLAGESGVYYKKAFWGLAGVFGFQKSVVQTPGASWIARPGASTGLAGSMPTATTASFISATSTAAMPEKPKAWSPTSSTSSSDDLDFDEKIGRLHRSDSSSSSGSSRRSPRTPTTPNLPDLPSIQIQKPKEVHKDVV